MARSASSKLSAQAGRGADDLRQLVGHANTLDYLAERLARRELNRKQEQQRQMKAEPDQKRRGSRDGSAPLGDIAEEPKASKSTPRTSPKSDERAEVSAVAGPKEGNLSSYFDLVGARETPKSPVDSIVALLDEGSDSEDSDEDSDRETESDSDDGEGCELERTK